MDKVRDGAEASKTKIQWHPGFRGAFRREFRKYRDYLRFEEEIPLTVGPLFADLLVIEVVRPVPMENELGKIFRKYNVCEYKSPDDALTVDDYYKTLAYACLYKCSARTADAIPAREITVSLIRDAYPRSLIQALEAEGFAVAERYPGVFYPEREGGGAFPFPAQIIVTSRLGREAHSGLRALRRPAESEDILRFLNEARTETEPGDIANVNAILSVSVAANAELYERIRKETAMLYPALRELMKDDLQDRWEAGLKAGLEEGLKKGQERERKESVRRLVNVYRNGMGLDDAAIAEQIAAEFQMTKEQAARYVRGQQA